jgi:hypothetical protein
MAASYFSDDTPGVFHELSKGDAAWGDFNGDGRWDLAVCGKDASANNKTYIYRNTGSDFVQQKELNIGGNGSLGWGDYDNDGDVDLLVVAEESNTILYKNDGSGNFVDAEVTGLGATQGGDTDLSWADFNNDGLLDVAVVGKYLYGVYKNNGDDSFTKITLPNIPYGVQFGCLAWGDYNSDGFIDLLIAGDFSEAGGGGSVETHLYKNNSGASFSDVTASHPQLEDVWRCGAAWGDLNNDMYLDMVLVGLSTGEILYVYENGGPGNSYELTKSTQLAGSAYASVGIADINGDDKLDIVTIGRIGSTESPLVYTNNGSFKFTKTDDSLEAMDDGGIALADYTGDGNPDLYINGEYNGNPKVELSSNTTSAKQQPKPVTGLASRYFNGKLYIMWNDPPGETNPDSYYYNFRVGSSEGGDDIIPSRYGSPLLGNYFTKITSNTITDPDAISGDVNVSQYKHVRVLNVSGSNYFWAVQSIDPALGYTWAVAGSTGSGWSEEQVFVDTSGPTGMPTVPTDDGDATYDKKLIFNWTKGTASDPQTGVYGCYIQIKEVDELGTETIVKDEELNKSLASGGIWESDDTAEYEYEGKLYHTYYVRVNARHGYTQSIPTSTYKPDDYGGDPAALWHPDSPHYTGWTNWSDGIQILKLLTVNNNLMRRPGDENDAVEIGYAITKDSQVKIRIFNILGELVKVVFDERVIKGDEQPVKWYGKTDAGDIVASGVYYVNIQASGSEGTDKVVVVK